jgi:hypothetical protein
MFLRISTLMFGLVISVSLFGKQLANSQTTYILKPTPKTVAWGYYDAKAAPVLQVKPGSCKVNHSTDPRV